MTAISWWLFVMTVATALLPVGILWSVIGYLHSRSRNELWLVRDSLVDDLLAGRIQRSPGADRLLRLVETHIRVAGRHTLGDLVLAVAVLRSRDLPPHRDEQFREGASESDRRLLDDYRTRLWEVSVRYLLSSSPIGWAMYATMWVRSHIGRLTMRKRPIEDRDRQRPIRFGIDLAERPTFRKARQVELGYLAEAMPSRRYRQKGERGPILEEMLSSQS